MMIFQKLSIISIALLLLLGGCSIDYKCQIRSNTSWSGAFDDRTVDGTGSTIIDIGDDPPVCCVVQKETENGYLEAEIISSGGWLCNPAEDGDKSRTTADYGLVSVCSGK
jgi:hypothetical protein